MPLMRRLLFLLLLAAPSFAQDLKIAPLGSFRLENGGVIEDCRIGYRVYGENNQKTIVVTTWLGGTTAGLASSIGPGKLFDSSKYRVIAIDALGDGVSSSPSNSPAPFPVFTIRDMVRTQYELLTKVLHVDHVYAMSGLSMGGMQTFQWLASYPDFMDKAIPITGTTAQTSYDLVLWKTQIQILESPLPNAMDIIADMNTMHLNTASYVMTHTKPSDVDQTLRAREAAVRSLNRLDYASQVRAAIAHDAGTIQSNARVLVVVSAQDQMVNPKPATEFAKKHGAELVTLTGDCGHVAPACEADLLRTKVHEFLDR
jgi:homoserine O-acetyltransferase